MKILVDETQLNLLLEKNKITHNHSIIAIKDWFNEFPNRFLLYYDDRWSCFLFLNFKEHMNNESFIINGISNKLKLNKDCITVEYLAEQIHEKFSESHKENRVYSHRLFAVKASEMQDQLKEDNFIIDGVQYKWMSIAEMEKDNHIMEINADIVGFVKSYCS